MKRTTIDTARLTLLPQRAAIARHQAAVAEVRRTRRQGRLARRPFPRRHRRTRVRRTRSAAHRAASGRSTLLPGKTLDSFDFDAVPMISKAQVMALCAGDAWLEKGANLLLFGPPGGGKSHLASAIGLALIENGWRVLFTRTSDLVQKLQLARRELGLEAAINRLDRFIC